jgi:hypothetical protein
MKRARLAIKNKYFGLSQVASLSRSKNIPYGEVTLGIISVDQSETMYEVFVGGRKVPYVRRNSHTEP